MNNNAPFFPTKGKITIIRDSVSNKKPNLLSSKMAASNSNNSNSATAAMFVKDNNAMTHFNRKSLKENTCGNAEQHPKMTRRERALQQWSQPIRSPNLGSNSTLAKVRSSEVFQMGSDSRTESEQYILQLTRTPQSKKDRQHDSILDLSAGAQQDQRLDQRIRVNFSVDNKNKLPHVHRAAVRQRQNKNKAPDFIAAHSELYDSEKSMNYFRNIAAEDIKDFRHCREDQVGPKKDVNDASIGTRVSLPSIKERKACMKQQVKTSKVLKLSQLPPSSVARGQPYVLSAPKGQLVQYLHTPYVSTSWKPEKCKQARPTSTQKEMHPREKTSTGKLSQQYKPVSSQTILPKTERFLSYSKLHGAKLRQEVEASKLQREQNKTRPKYRKEMVTVKHSNQLSTTRHRLDRSETQSSQFKKQPAILLKTNQSVESSLQHDGNVEHSSDKKGPSISYPMTGDQHVESRAFDNVYYWILPKAGTTSAKPEGPDDGTAVIVTGSETVPSNIGPGREHTAKSTLDEVTISLKKNSGSQTGRLLPKVSTTNSVNVIRSFERRSAKCESYIEDQGQMKSFFTQTNTAVLIAGTEENTRVDADAPSESGPPSVIKSKTAAENGRSLLKTTRTPHTPVDDYRIQTHQQFRVDTRQAFQGARLPGLKRTPSLMFYWKPKKVSATEHVQWRHSAQAIGQYSKSSANLVGRHSTFQGRLGHQNSISVGLPFLTPCVERHIGSAIPLVNLLTEYRSRVLPVISAPSRQISAATQHLKPPDPSMEVETKALATSVDWFSRFFNHCEGTRTNSLASSVETHSKSLAPSVDTQAGSSGGSGEGQPSSIFSSAYKPYECTCPCNDERARSKEPSSDLESVVESEGTGSKSVDTQSKKVSQTVEKPSRHVAYKAEVHLKPTVQSDDQPTSSVVESEKSESESVSPSADAGARSVAESGEMRPGSMVSSVDKPSISALPELVRSATSVPSKLGIRSFRSIAKSATKHARDVLKPAAAILGRAANQHLKLPAVPEAEIESQASERIETPLLVDGGNDQFSAADDVATFWTKPEAGGESGQSASGSQNSRSSRQSASRQRRTSKYGKRGSQQHGGRTSTTGMSDTGSTSSRRRQEKHRYMMSETFRQGKRDDDSLPPGESVGSYASSATEKASSGGGTRISRNLRESKERLESPQSRETSKDRNGEPLPFLQRGFMPSASPRVDDWRSSFPNADSGTTTPSSAGKDRELSSERKDSKVSLSSSQAGKLALQTERTSPDESTLPKMETKRRLSQRVSFKGIVDDVEQDSQESLNQAKNLPSDEPILKKQPHTTSSSSSQNSFIKRRYSHSRAHRPLRHKTRNRGSISKNAAPE